MKLLLAVALLTGFAAPASAGQVWTVDDNGPADFATLAAAVAAAADGDTILVRDGYYSNLDLSGKALTLVAQPAVPPAEQIGLHQIAGVAIANLPAGKTVTLRGFRLVKSPFNFATTGAVQLVNNSGTIVFEDCVLEPTFSTAATLQSSGSAAVFLVRCFATGLAGQTPILVAPQPPRSAIAAVASNVYVYGSTIFGGNAATASFPSDFGPGGPAHDGAPAIDLTGGRLFVSGGSITGGKGGNNNFNGTDCAGAGDGGPAVRLAGADPQLHLQAATLTGGLPGTASGACPAGTPGPQADQQSGSITNIPGVARSIRLSALVEENGTASISLAGAPGESLSILFSADLASGLWIPNLQGGLLPGFPMLVFKLIGMPPSGELELAITIPVSLPPEVGAAVLHAQTLVGFVGGKPLLSAPSSMTVLRAER